MLLSVCLMVCAHRFSWIIRSSCLRLYNSKPQFPFYSIPFSHLSTPCYLNTHQQQTHENPRKLYNITQQEKVQNVQQIKTNNNSAIVTATLHPHSPKSEDDDNNNVEEEYVEQTPQQLIEHHYSKNRRGELLGNDEFYASLYHDDDEGGGGDDGNSASSSGGDDSDSGSSNGRFQLRIAVSKANDGVSTKKFHDGLFNLLKDSSSDNSEKGSSGGGVDEGIILQEMINSDEQLMVLQQQALDARLANNETEGKLIGYYVTIMLCEPHVPNEEVVIPPPSFLDKLDGTFKAVPYSQSSQAARDDNDAATAGNGYHGGGNQHEGGVFSPSNKDNICTSQQFVAPGPWEKANLKAFELIALDVKKALVRVEFPLFSEGCKNKTFREVYQLNARVSVIFVVGYAFVDIASSTFISDDPSYLAVNNTAAQIWFLRDRVSRDT